MKLLADLHISPRTVAFLRSQGHDTVRVTDVMAATSSDQEIVLLARKQGRVILTQGLDFSNIVALSGETQPSLITLRLSSSRIELVNDRLSRVLPELETTIYTGILVTISDKTIRKRQLPIG